MSIGKVKRFDADKGCGFITIGAGQDLLVYYFEVQTSGFRTLEEGTEVNFEVNASDRGDHAADVAVT